MGHPRVMSRHWTTNTLTTGDGPEPLTGPCAADPDLWFSVNERDQAEAKRICHTCPNVTECLAKALAKEGGLVAEGRYGVWGAKTPTERASIARRTRRNRAA